MIYIDENTTEIKISKHSNGSQQMNELLLVNNLSGNEYSYIPSETSYLNAFYYTLKVSGFSIPVGEYTFYLKNRRDEVIESGLLTYGDYTPTSSTTYSTEKSQDIIYERN